MKLIIGLGNPGSAYHHTRHNVGFMMVESFFTDWREEKKMKSMISSEYRYPGYRHAVVPGAQHPSQKQILS